MRRQFLPAAGAALLLAVGVTGCGMHSDTAASCDAPLKPGLVSDSIPVSTNFGSAPEKVTLPEDLSFSRTEASTVTAEHRRDGANRAMPGDLATIDVTIIDGHSGETTYQSRGYGSASGSDFVPVPEVDTEAPISLGTALICAAPGERHVIAFAPQDTIAFAQSFGTTPGSPVVAIVDVNAVSNVTDGGRTRSLPNGFPAVTTNEAGTPGVVMPPTGPPSEVRVAEYQEGTGHKIRAADRVVVQVLQVNWDGTLPRGNSWEAGPQLLQAEGRDAPGWREKLTGLRAGSLAVILQPQSAHTPAGVLVVKLLAAG